MALYYSSVKEDDIPISSGLNIGRKPTDSVALSTTIIPTNPVKVVVGERYKFLVQGAITNAKVEKIYQDQTGETYLVLTIDIISDKWNPGTQTSTLTLSEFKLRLLKGGINEIVI